MQHTQDITTLVVKALSGAERDTLPIAVIVTGRARPGYLRDTLASVSYQDPVPSEMVYIDDGSVEGGAALAEEYDFRAVPVERVTFSLPDCRNAGTAHTSQPYLIFMDAGQIMPPGYAKKMLDRITDSPRYGFAFPRMNGTHRQAGYLDLARADCVHNSSIVRREAILSIHGWLDLPDWDFWLRIAEGGWQFAQANDAKLTVRGEEENITCRQSQSDYITIQASRPLTVFVPFGPGGPMRGMRYFATLESLGIDRDKATLFFYDNTNDPEWGRKLRNYLTICGFQSTVYYKDNGRVPDEDGPGRILCVPERMAEIWTHASEFFRGAFVLSFEDDVEPECPNALHRLYEALDPDVDAVSAICKNRPTVDGSAQDLILDWYQREDGELALHYTDTFPGGVPDVPHDGYFQVGATGLGMTLIRLDALEGFQYDTGRYGSWCGQDYGLWRHVRDRGKKLMVHCGVRLKHWYEEEKYV